MKKVTIIAMILFLMTLLLERKGLFIASPVQARECKSVSEFSSKAQKVHLVELFTSEGCSSCPPAEKWLNSLYNSKNLYKDFIPLAFHVDYWDYIGHKDPLASPAYSNRQRKYAALWNSSTVYTPGFVLNGKEWRSLRRTIPEKSQENVGVLSVRKKEAQYSVSFAPEKKEKEYRYHFALLTLGLENKIRRGENSGKTLKHYFVVDSLQTKVGSEKGVKFKIPKAKSKATQFAVAAWVSTPGIQTPLQATAHCINL